MIDTASKAAESRKAYKKAHGDGEDPIIIAQRFLNIFRQLHIFSPERKDAFNKMILEQPPEIRGMFGSLPGGSLLQEYVDDLEQKAGIIRDHTGEFVSSQSSSPEMSEEISKAKILATALAEAQAQAAANVQAQPIYSAAPQAPLTGGTTRVVADASFAKEIGAAFSQALKFSEEKMQLGNKQLAAAVIASQEKMAKIFAEKTDTSDLTKSLIASQEKMAQALSDNALALQKLPIKSFGGGKETSFSGGNNQEILDAIRESQDRMAQMIMQHNTMAASNSSNNNANNIQINTAPMPPLEDMVKGIVKAQSELFQEMAQAQTRELSAIISVALKESQQLSAKTIAEAIEKIQKENRKFFAEQSHKVSPMGAAAPYSSKHLNDDTFTNDIEDIDNDIKTTKISQKNTDEFSELFSSENNFNISDNASLDAEENSALEPVAEEISEESSKKKKKKKKKKNKNKPDSDNGGLDFSLFDDGTQAVSKIKDGLSSLASSLFKKDSAEESFDEHFENSELAQDTPTLDDDILASLPPEQSENNPILEWEDAPVEEELQAEPVEAEEINEQQAEDETEWEWEEVPEDAPVQEELQAEPVEAEEINEPQAEDETEWEWEEVPEDAPVEEELQAEPVEAEEINEQQAEDESEWEWEEVPEDAPVQEELQAEPVEAEEINEPQAEDETEWEWEEVPEDAPVQEELQAEPVEAEEITEPQAEDETEWEWEEVPEDAPVQEELQAEPVEAEEINEQQAEDESEWEWEEVPEDAPVQEELQAEPVEAEEINEQQAEDETEWEWEEVPEDAPVQEELQAEPVEAEEISEPQAEDETEWEWTYEDDSEEAPVAASADGEAKNEEEWEWAYEEDSSPDDTTVAENQALPQENPITFNTPDNSKEVNNPLYSGDLVFQDSLYNSPEDTISLGGMDFNISELGKDTDSKEPYAPKDDIVG